MPRRDCDYRAPRRLWGGHAQTIAAKLFRYPSAPFRRELRPDSTGKTLVAYDFIDPEKPESPTVVLFHGLEGSSRSHYAQALARAVYRRGQRLAVVHFRGCGGVPNTAPLFYHSGDSFEIDFVLENLRREFGDIRAVGVSLGGNALAKYLGERGENAAVTAAATVSTPFRLPAAAEALDKPFARMVYAPYFLRTLIPKAAGFNGESPRQWRDCRTLRDFDNRFTAKLYDFVDADDYYRHASSEPWLARIAVPTLLLNAQNDPFFPAEALPDEKTVASAVTLMQPEQGGHAGFIDTRRLDALSWLPETVLDFFDEATS